MSNDVSPLSKRSQAFVIAAPNSVFGKLANYFEIVGVAN